MLERAAAAECGIEEEESCRRPGCSPKTLAIGHGARELLVKLGRGAPEYSAGHEATRYRAARALSMSSRPMKKGLSTRS